MDTSDVRPGTAAGHGAVDPARAEDRTVDAVVAGALLGALSPLIAARAAVALIRQKRVFDQHRRLGRGGRPIVVRSFAGRSPGRRLAYLFSVAAGELRLVGPRPLHPFDAAVEERSPEVTPGLMSPDRLRARTGIDYETEAQEIDQSLTNAENLGLMARYVVAEFLGGAARPTPQTLTILGVELTNTSMDEAVDWVLARAASRRTTMLAFVNPDCLNKAVQNPGYRSILTRAAARVLPDGIGIKVAAGFQGLDVRENINGTDMFPRLCARAAATGVPIYLLGARPGVARAVAEEMTRVHPDLKIVGTHDGYFTAEDEPALTTSINESGAQILLVALGVPRQEFWLARNLPHLKVGVAMGVGGLFDFYSGRIPRAPRWVREIGLEWVWRLCQEPGRMWRRYLVGNPLFLIRTWQEAAKVRPLREKPVQRPGLLGYGYYGKDR